MVSLVSNHDYALLEGLLSKSNRPVDMIMDSDVDKIVDLDVSQEIKGDNDSDSSQDDDDERLVDVSFIVYNSDVYEEIEKGLG